MPFFYCIVDFICSWRNILLSGLTTVDPAGTLLHAGG